GDARDHGQASRHHDSARRERTPRGRRERRRLQAHPPRNARSLAAYGGRGDVEDAEHGGARRARRTGSTADGGSPAGADHRARRGRRGPAAARRAPPARLPARGVGVAPRNAPVASRPAPSAVPGPAAWLDVRGPFLLPLLLLVAARGW